MAKKVTKSKRNNGGNGGSEHCPEDMPKKGDEFYCHGCGMRIVVIADCGCDDGSEDHFMCCGEVMHKCN